MTDNTRHHNALLNRVLVRMCELGCLVWHAKVGKFRMLRSEHVVSVGIKGMADIVGWLPDGRGICVEIKTGSGRQSPAQRVWQLACVRCGVVYIVVRSVDEFEAWFLRYTATRHEPERRD